MPGDDLDVIWKTVPSLFILSITFVTNRPITKLLRRRIKEASHRQTLHMLIRNSVLILGSVSILAVWLGFGSSFTAAMGILGAGIAFASQEVIVLSQVISIFSPAIFTASVTAFALATLLAMYWIYLLRTMVMEIGKWVKADQYTGRIVSVANRAVFSDPVVNYTQHWSFFVG
jgi:small-conductance mechanosensitive channel